MAAEQGYRRLLKGAEKKITESEAKKGYFFVTNDKLAIATLGKKFDVKFGKHLLKDRHIDSYGRISVGRQLLRENKERSLTMKFEGKSLLVTIK